MALRAIRAANVTLSAQGCLVKAAGIHTGGGSLKKEWLVTLNTGEKVPAFGLGTWTSESEQIGPALETAVKLGYRHFDCAKRYGNVSEVGESFQKCFREGLVKREELFITAKLWNTDHGREDVVPACQEIIRELQLSYIDLFSIHWPFTLRKGSGVYQWTKEDKIGYDPERMAKTWEGMEECVTRGLSKTIGLSNFTITKTERILQTANIIPVANQVECHLYFQQNKLKQYCDSKGIIISASFPLGSPMRPAAIRQESDPVVMDDPVLKEIARKHNASAAQVCIAYTLSRGMMVPPKTVDPKELRENIEATDLVLDSEDIRRLSERNRDYKLMKATVYFTEDMTYEKFWDVVEDEQFEIKN